MRYYNTSTRESTEHYEPCHIGVQRRNAENKAYWKNKKLKQLKHTK